MDWEVMTTDTNHGGRFTGTQPDGSSPPGSGSVKHRDSDEDGQAECGFSSGTFYGYMYIVEFGENTYGDDWRDCNTADDEAWRIRNSDFNPLYFDPDRTYTPWPGVDAAGNPFQDMPITAAKANPYDPNSETIDLTRHNSNWKGGTKRATSDRDGDGVPDGFRYYTWTDLDGDGLFDDGEQTEHLIKDADAATQQNFANWFSYYRSREFAAKAAYGKVIANATNVRMGLVTLHNNNSVNTPIRLMNADPATGNKRSLLDELYSIHSASGTPLRSSLKNAGRYLECKSNSLFSSCPALPAEDGGACQQNFVVLMTDGFYNGGSPSIGNTDGPGDGNTAWDGGAFADNRSDTLADVAMHYYERDLQPGLSDNVPITPGVDEANHQHMVTYTVAFGVNGQLTSDPPNTMDPFNWPNPFSSDAGKIDDLRHAAFNGRGAFLSASNPDQLIAALDDAISSIAERTSSAASVALNSGSHNANSRVYQARFNSGDWSGQLLSLPVDSSGNVSSPEWDAGVVLNSLNYDTDRVILTYDPSSGTGIPLRWNQLSPYQQALLHTDPDGIIDGEGEARLEYLRGSAEHEGTGNGYRTRLNRLGDLINSDPFFVGAPPFPDSLGDGYAAFRSAYSSRTPMVYIGGNDGMLHGFDANNGTEKLAYVPNLVFNNLSQLTDPQYTHRYFVDGSPTVGDAYGNFGSRCPQGSPCWRSVLISGLRHGGQGFFALDVTDPSLFHESDASRLVLWEFSDADDPDLGYSFSQPSIVKMANGRWAAVFSNGYNNSQSDPGSCTGSGNKIPICHIPPGNPNNPQTLNISINALDTHLDHGDSLGACGEDTCNDHVSTSGHAVLYIVFIDGGVDGTWTPGTDFVKIDTGEGSPGTPNGLASPAPVDLDGDFVVEYIYAGDLRGNLWRFDVRDTSPANWGAPARVFIAKDATNNPQPITTRPEVGAHPDPQQPGALIYFGTGKYLEDGDNTTSGVPTQTFYAIWDKLEASPAVVTRSSLVQQTVLSESAGQRITSNNEVDWDTHRGWYLDLPTAGERQVSDPVLRNDRIIFTTLIPNTQICGFGGSSWLMELDARTGSRLGTSPFDLNDDDTFDDNDKVTVIIDGSEESVAISGLQSTEGILPSPTILNSGTTEIKYNSGSRGGVFITMENPGPSAVGRQAWRQFQ
jgi:type IV pilus assembly protein PilY1